MKRVFLCLTVITVALAATAQAQVLKSTLDDQTNVEVTVYNSNLGLIKDTRNVTLPTGQGELRFMDVAASIRPVTVTVKSLNAPDQFMVLEQNYEYDLISPAKLLEKYIGKDVQLVNFNEDNQQTEKINATLLSTNQGEIYKIDDQIYIGYPGYKILPEIPENLIAKPTLTWLYKNGSAQAHQLEVSYLTDSISWLADYVMTVDQNDVSAGLNGWVTVNNLSGAEYRNATLKLVAGEVNRVADENIMTGRMRKQSLAMAESDASFAEQAFFEYHIYDLQRPTTIKNNQTKQISLLEASGIKIDKEYVLRGEQYYYRNQYNEVPKTKVGVYLKFKNEEKNKLGMPLPAGTIRLYKADAKGKLQFIGEDNIDHTPKDEEIKLKIGEAFDIVAERKQMDFQNLGTYTIETKWQVTLRNHKEEDVVVTVIEPVSGEWHVMDSTHDYEKLDANQLKFRIPVPKDGAVNLIYRVRVSYR